MANWTEALAAEPRGRPPGQREGDGAGRGTGPGVICGPQGAVAAGPPVQEQPSAANGSGRACPEKIAGGRASLSVPALWQGIFWRAQLRGSLAPGHLGYTAY